MRFGRGRSRTAVSCELRRREADRSCIYETAALQSRCPKEVGACWGRFPFDLRPSVAFAPKGRARAAPQKVVPWPAVPAFHNAPNDFARTLNTRDAIRRAVYYLPIGHVDFAENWGEGTFGITIRRGARRSSCVDRDSAADRQAFAPATAGRSRGFRNAAHRVRSPYPGERETLTFGAARDLHRHVDGGTNPELRLLAARRRRARLPSADRLLIVAFLLVFLRPSIMSWSFYVSPSVISGRARPSCTGRTCSCRRRSSRSRSC